MFYNGTYYCHNHKVAINSAIKLTSQSTQFPLNLKSRAFHYSILTSLLNFGYS